MILKQHLLYASFLGQIHLQVPGVMDAFTETFMFPLSSTGTKVLLKAGFAVGKGRQAALSLHTYKFAPAVHCTETQVLFEAGSTAGRQSQCFDSILSRLHPGAVYGCRQAMLVLTG